jgi:5-methyltetrahydrofolate--homocysteine methyltransferase
VDDLRRRLAAGDVLLADGATGTWLLEHGLEPGASPEALGLERPDLLEELARLYREAGADILTSNTFGGSPLRLAPYGLEERTEEVNRVAVEAARRAAGDRAYLAGSVGPSGRLLEPFGDLPLARLEASFHRQARALIAARVDLVVVETMTDLDEAVAAVAAVRAGSPRLPVVATMTFDPTPKGFFTVHGVGVERAAAALRAAGADVVGANCGRGIDDMVALGRAFRAATPLPLAIQANAGLPLLRDGRAVYPDGPEAMAARASELLDLGVQVLGGCCGTTPEHIRALRRVIDRRR